MKYKFFRLSEVWKCFAELDRIQGPTWSEGLCLNLKAIWNNSKNQKPQFSLKRHKSSEVLSGMTNCDSESFHVSTYAINKAVGCSYYHVYARSTWHSIGMVIRVASAIGFSVCSLYVCLYVLLFLILYVTNFLILLQWDSHAQHSKNFY